jgi:hypothetical protein
MGTYDYSDMERVGSYTQSSGSSSLSEESYILGRKANLSYLKALDEREFLKVGTHRY